jgi:hypothetical protein
LNATPQYPPLTAFSPTYKQDRCVSHPRRLCSSHHQARS